ncbi:MAG: 50S ribosomal protein L15 [Acidobacteria bacterium]|nr:50S ribosomal protein L15 [Acidobacteriota bacterium]
MGLNNLRPPAGSTHSKKHRGGGMGSGLGKTAGRGYKGQKSRSGARSKRGFEGGQMPLHRRLPKRGFTNIFKKEYAIVNLHRLKDFPAGSTVSPQELLEKGIVKNLRDGVKILGQGDLAHALNISAHLFSKSAQEKIAKAGGRFEVIK